jgi:endoglucanase
VIDIHNYGRWDDTIIGQGGPTNAQFASLWTQLATKYKDEEKVVFGLMNEPHDLNIVMWAETVQAAVTAIRQAGATTQMILLPGTNFTCAVTFVSTGSATALSSVVNLDNTTTNLVFDVHQYLDFDNSGTHDTCAVNNTAGFISLAAWLRENGRQAIIGETGAGGTESVSFTPDTRYPSLFILPVPNPPCTVPPGFLPPKRRHQRQRRRLHRLHRLGRRLLRHQLRPLHDAHACHQREMDR